MAHTWAELQRVPGLERIEEQAVCALEWDSVAHIFAVLLGRVDPEYEALLGRMVTDRKKHREREARRSTLEQQALNEQAYRSVFSKVLVKTVRTAVPDAPRLASSHILHPDQHRGDIYRCMTFLAKRVAPKSAAIDLGTSTAETATLPKKPRASHRPPSGSSRPPSSRGSSGSSSSRTGSNGLQSRSATGSGLRPGSSSSASSREHPAEVTASSEDSGELAALRAQIDEMLAESSAVEDRGIDRRRLLLLRAQNAALHRQVEQQARAIAAQSDALLRCEAAVEQACIKLSSLASAASQAEAAIAPTDVSALVRKLELAAASARQPGQIEVSEPVFRLVSSHYMAHGAKVHAAGGNVVDVAAVVKLEAELADLRRQLSTVPPLLEAASNVFGANLSGELRDQIDAAFADVLAQLADCTTSLTTLSLLVPPKH
eukprot:m.65848 g.65848  ORF g.65848 m.65848 type:complete len:431 (+) comp7592_c0_seq2:98-1390(+)